MVRIDGLGIRGTTEAEALAAQSTGERPGTVGVSPSGWTVIPPSGIAVVNPLVVLLSPFLPPVIHLRAMVQMTTTLVRATRRADPSRRCTFSHSHNERQRPFMRVQNCSSSWYPIS